MDEHAADNTRGSYASLRNNPIEDDRSTTDFPIVLVFPILLAIWLWGVIEGLPDGGYESSLDRTWLSCLRYIVTSTYASILVYHETYPVLAIGLIGAPLLLNCLLVARQVPIFFIYLAIVCLCLSIPARIYLATTYAISSDFGLASKITTGCWHSLNVVCCVTLLLCIRRANIGDVARLMKKSLRSMLFYRCLLPCFSFGLAISFVNGLVFYYTGRRIDRESLTRNYTCYVVACSLLVHSVNNYARMVMAGVLASWHSARRKNDLSWMTIVRCSYVVARYHLGSATYGATYVLPLGLAAYHAVKSTQRPQHPLTGLACKIFLIFNVSNYALILTALRGYSFSHASSQAFHLMVKKSSLSVVALNVFKFVLDCGSMIMCIGITLLYACAADDSHHGIRNPELMIDTGLGYTLAPVMLVSAYLIADTAVSTALLYTLKEEEEKEGVTGNGALEKIHNQIPLTESPILAHP